MMVSPERVLLARCNDDGAAPTVMDVAEFRWPESLDRNNAGAVGPWLRGVLSERRWTTGDLVGVVARAELSMRWFDLPRVGVPGADRASGSAPLDPSAAAAPAMSGSVTLDNETISMARMQMQRHVAGDGADVVIDAMDVGPRWAGAGGPEQTTRSMLGVAAPKRLIDWWRSVAKSAGLGLRGVVPHPVCVARAIRRADELECVLGVARGAGTVELVLARGPSPLLARSIEWSDSAASDADASVSEAGLERLRVEARRTLAAYAAGSGVPVAGVVPVGEGALVRSGALECARELGLALMGDVSTSDAGTNLGAATDLDVFVPLMFASRAIESGIDLAHPRRVREAPSTKRTLALAGVLGLIVLGGGGYVASLGMLRDLEDRVDKAKKQNAELDAVYSAVLLKDARASHIDHWASQGNFGWLSHLRWLSDAMPETSRAMLDEFRGTLAAPVTFVPKDARYDLGAWKCVPAAQFTITGKTKEREVSNTLRQRLVATQIYGVESKGADMEDRFVFELTTSWKTPTPLEGPVPSEGTKTPSKGGSGSGGAGS